MYFIKLDDLKTVEKLTKLCEKHKDYMETDICFGRYVIDGASVLAVASLIGNIVSIRPMIKEDELISAFYEEFKEIGGWSNKTEHPAKLI